MGDDAEVPMNDDEAEGQQVARNADVGKLYFMSQEAEES
ncbi:uncharacterized protein G2W53_043280 [Senna tora]|uniref:Uncharacterized protein n=1 Tax=Senna tora TaxID=362788 RepID=A0A834W4T5_9FABA|nr:uncharacterized protein G2W53_043280 [Senna tora]